MKQAVDALAKTGASRYVIDLRGTSRGDLDDGVAAARLFVKDGPLAVRLTKGDQREPILAQAGDGAVTAPVALLIDTERPAPPKCSPPRSTTTTARSSSA